MFVGLIFLVLTVIVAASTPLFMKYQKKKKLEGRYSKRHNKEEEVDDTKEKAKAQENLKELWGIEDIQNDMVLTSDGLYRMIVRIGSLDYYLLSVQEQTAVEDVLLQTIMAFKFPVQLYTTTEMVDTKSCIQTMYSQLAREDLANNLRAYISDNIQYMDNLMQNRAVHVRRSYIVVSLNNPKDIQKAQAELYRRATVVAGGFSRNGVRSEILTSEGIVDLLHNVLNRGRTFKPSDAIAAGGMDLYKTKAMGGNPNAVLEEKSQENAG